MNWGDKPVERRLSATVSDTSGVFYCCEW